MKEIKHVVKDPMGIHARPAGQLVKLVSGYESNVTVFANNGRADAKRLMAVMRLAVKHGMEMTVQVEGADEEQAASAVEAFLQTNL